jgi:hypothetical protein
MRAKLDSATTLQTQFDSGALTPLCTVIHRIQEPGLYQGEVLSDSRVADRFSVQAGPKETGSQVNIDLAAIQRMQRESFQVQAPGAVVFFVSRGTEGLAVRLRRAGARAEDFEFDSRELGENDAFTTTLLQPGTYEVEMQGRRERQRVQVRAAARGEQQRYVPPTPILLRQPGQQGGSISEVGQAQTLVFQENTGARVKVRLTQPAQETQVRGVEQRAGKISWRKPQ